MNYNIIAIVYIISLIVLTFAFTSKNECNNLNQDNCELNKHCNFNNNKCENKLNDNATYLIMIFGLLIFYLFLIKINLSYLLLDLKFRKMILIIPFLYLSILIVIYIYLDKEGLTKLIIYNVIIIFFYYINNGFILNTKLINIVFVILVIIGTLLFFKKTMLLHIFQVKKENCTNKLRKIYYGEDNSPIKDKDCPKMNLDTCYSLEELQELYKKISKKDCSFCVDYVDNEFKCQTNSYCNQYMNKIYNEDCKNSNKDIKALINPYVKEYNDDISADKNTDYILECNELNSQIPNLIEVDVTTESKVSDLINKIKIRDGYDEVFKFENKELDKDKTLAQSNIKNKSIIDLSFIHT